jgi:hypothetical protein
MRVYYFGTRPVLPYLANQVQTDGNMNAIRTVDRSPDGGVNFENVFGGRHCETQNFATRVEWRARSYDPATIGDFNTGPNGVLHVSKRAMDFIEHLERSVHQFVPFDMLKAGKPLERRYWWVIGNRIDGVDRQASNYVMLSSPIGDFWRSAQDVARVRPDRLPPGTDINAAPILVFSPEQIGSACIWRDKHSDVGGPLVAAAFADALRLSELTGYKLTEAGADQG